MKRRKFLAGSAVAAATLAYDPIFRFVGSVCKNIIAEAQAEASGTVGSCNFVSIMLKDAPARFTFDLWLRADASDPAMIYNPIVATGFDFSQQKNYHFESPGTIYETIDYRGMLVPRLFAQQVKTTANANRPLTDLLDNMLVIRGYGSNMDGHTNNSVLQQLPLAGAPSLAGLAADHSNTPFSAVQFPARNIFDPKVMGGNWGAFYSAQGKPLSVTDGETVNSVLHKKPLHQLLNGLKAPAQNRQKAAVLKDRIAQSYELAQATLRMYASGSSESARIVSQNISKAQLLIKKGISDLESFWTSATEKYEEIINNGMRLPAGIPSLTSQALLSPQLTQELIDQTGAGLGSLLEQYQVADTMVSSDFYWPDSSFDMRKLTAGMGTTFLADGLAMAEFLIREKYCSSIELQSGELTGLYMKVSPDSFGTAEVNFVGTKDMHYTGCYPTVLLTTAYFRGLSAGLLEFADRLKMMTQEGVNVWDNTVVQVFGDFNRSACSNGTGSDHGYNQMSTSVFSGRIKQPMLVGNIQQKGYGEDIIGTQLGRKAFNGTMGLAAPIPDYNQKGMPSPIMAASTIAAVMGVQDNPWANSAEPLVRLDNGEVKYNRFGKGKVIV